jgi:RNA polymerase sigma-70 factor, ECF subfamily
MPTIEDQLDHLYRTDSRRIFATLVRLLGDFDLAEEAMHEAFAAAIVQWAAEGIPANPSSWLISTGRFKAIDIIRRNKRFAELQPDVATHFVEIKDANETRANLEIEDDRLRLIFTCCHPAIDSQVQVPLTLREVCGLTTEEIARAFLVAPATMAQRIVRGKAKIRDAGIPYVVPARTELSERLDSVLSVIYLVFNEGYSASAGDEHTRASLSDEAIRLARLVLELLPDPEVMGLLALMLLHESRRQARTDDNGDIILLEDQDRSKWNRVLIEEGKELIERSLASRWLGAFTLQAAISAVHADAGTPDETDWRQIVGLYDVLQRALPSPVVELNRAVAVAKRDGVQSGLELVENILGRGDLSDYYLAHSARGEFLRQLGRTNQARHAFEQALALAKQEPERRFLGKKISALDVAISHE